MDAPKVIYFSYPDYIEKYGNTLRPAIVRTSFSSSYQGRDRYGNYVESEIVTFNLYLDGRKFSSSYNNNDSTTSIPDAIYFVKPYNQTGDKGNASNDMVARAFDVDDANDWYSLFWEYIQFTNMNDTLSFAIVANALELYRFQSSVIAKAICMYHGEEQAMIIDVLDYISWSLSVKKNECIATVLKKFGHNPTSIFPTSLLDAARYLKLDSIQYDSVHMLSDRIVSNDNRYWGDNDTHVSISDLDSKVILSNQVLSLLNWIKHKEIGITNEIIASVFPYLNDETRTIVLRRFFYDVKCGRNCFNEQTSSMFTATGNQNYGYYSQMRYIYESWPGDRNVSDEFLLDCIITYQQTNQERFQVTNGILDWSIQKSVKCGRPIQMRFNDWLKCCSGGVLQNPEFGGYADFFTKYEFTEEGFEHEAVWNSIVKLRQKYCKQISHLENEPKMDPETGKQVTGENGELQYISKQVFENKWSFDDKGNDSAIKEIIDLFVNWELKPEDITQRNVFSLEMIDPSIVRQKVIEYSEAHYSSASPVVSDRSKHDEIVKLFGTPVRMFAKLSEEVEIGSNPGVDLESIKDKVLCRLKEVYGESLECEYDPDLLWQIKKDTLFRTAGKDSKAFICKQQCMGKNWPIYCAPELSEARNFLTEHQFAICRGDMCFRTCIQKEPEWQQYSLINILEILGYSILEETDAGFIPCSTYNAFVAQVNKAIRFYKRLRCQECGHILFPITFGFSKGINQYNKFTCLLPTCKEYKKEIYLSYCFQCKKGLIDSRETKKCPNGLYICPSCNSCCSNELFDKTVEKYKLAGKLVPSRFAAMQGLGHKDSNQVFCYKCGSEKFESEGNWLCPECDRIETEGRDYGEIPAPTYDEYQMDTYNDIYETT